MAGQQQVWRYKSTARARSLVLLALGVVKVATAGQLRQLVLPGTADEQTVRNAAKDLRDAGLTESLGRSYRPGRTGTPVAQDLWNLTAAGLAAAASELGRPVKEMGGTARDAARAGAAHALAVADTIDAFRQSPPLATKPVARRTAPAQRRRPPALRPRGLGHLRGWSTEVALPVYGTFTTPAKGSLRADAVLTAPEDGMPVLFVEVDRFSEPAAVLSRKIVDYREFFRRRLPDTRDRHVPLWSSQWPAPELVSHPPLALVFAKDVTDTVLQRRIAEVRGNTRDCWGAPWTSYLGLGAPNPREEDGWRQYGDIVPVITTTLAQLQQRGPHGPVWTRFGRSRPEPLTDALTHRNTHEDYMEREERLQAARTPPPGYGDSQHGAPMKDPWTQPEEDPGEDEPPGWECPSCHTPTSTAAPGLDGYAPEPGGRCPRCEQVHRELTQSRTQTGVLARLRARAEGRHPSSPGA